VTKHLTDGEFTYNTLCYGGASRNTEDGSVPVRGYMVSAPTDDGGTPIPEIRIPVGDFCVDDVKAHLATLHDFITDRDDIYQGSWVEEGDVVLDASECIIDLVEAMSVATMRGQRAIYDLAAGEDFIL
jgi:hypothetical protein